MTTTLKRFTLREYLRYDDGTDTRYELVNGELIPMSLGTWQHGKIIRFLGKSFDNESERLRRDWVAIPALVGIRSPRAGQWDTCRVPDVTLIRSDQWNTLNPSEAIIELSDSRPFLLVEVVSESTKSTDYRAKRSEYAVLDIQEYWIVDPLEEKVLILNLLEGAYEAQTFSGTKKLVSLVFPDLDLIAEQVLQGS